MTLWAYTLREVWRRPGRTLLTLLSVAVGVAAVVATALTIEAAHRAYRELFDGLSGPNALEATAPAGAGFDAALGTELETVPGVQAVTPGIRTTAALRGKCGVVPALVCGMEPMSALASGDFPLDSGRSLGAAGEIVLEGEFARANGFELGQAVSLWSPAGPAKLTLVGRFRPRSQAPAGTALALVSLADAQRLFLLPGKVNRLHIRLTPDADPRQVAVALGPRLPFPLEVEAPGGGDELARASLASVEQGLSALGAVALVAATFVLCNTFQLNLGERRRQLAILRALGATQAQVQRLLLREALLLGLVGAAVGCAAGYGLALALTAAMGRLMGVPVPAPQPDAGSFLLAASLGPVVALVATWFPARSACRQPPLHDLLERPDGDEQGAGWTSGLAGLVLGSLGAGGLCGLCAGVLPAALLGPSIALLLTGAVLALPWVMTPLLTGLGRVLARISGVEGDLAHRQLARHPARTALTVGVLFVAVVTALAFGQSLLNDLRDLRRWCRRAIPADFLVRASLPDTALLLTTALPDSLGDDLAHLEGVAAVDRIAFVPARIEGRPVLVLARTFNPRQSLPLDIRGGPAPEGLRRRIAEGGAVLDVGLARRLGVGPRDRITLETATGPCALSVAGTATEYAGGGSALYLEWETARRLLPVPGAHAFLVTARPGAVQATAEALRGFCESRGLLPQSNEELRGEIEHLLARVTAALWGLMVLAFVVASLGIANTLTLNVRQQARDLAVLRALGLTRQQAGRVVSWQALLLGWAALVPGVGGGIGLAYLLNRATNALNGRQVSFRVDVLLVLGACGLALAVGQLAALLPGRRAAGVRILHALRLG